MLLVLLVLKRSALPLPGPVAVPPLCAHRSAALRAMAARTRSMTSSITTATSSGTNIGRKRESLVLLSLAAPERTLPLSGRTFLTPLSDTGLAPSVLFSLAEIR